MKRFDNYIEVTALDTGIPMLVNIDSIISVETSEYRTRNGNTHAILYLQGHAVGIVENVPDIEHLLQVTKYP